MTRSQDRSVPPSDQSIPERGHSASHEGDEALQLKLEALRRSAGLSIDSRGRWWHQGEIFEHPRVIAALSAGLDWRPERSRASSQASVTSHDRDLKSARLSEWLGEATTRIGDHWCYVECDVTPFLVLKIEESPDDSTLVVTLNNQERWPLKALELSDEVIYAHLSPKRVARFSSAAQAQCERWLNQDEHGLFELVYSDRRWPIRDSLSTSSE